MTKELEGSQLGLIIVGGLQDLTVSHDGREKACRHALALGGSNDLKGPGHIDEVLLGPLAWMSRPRASIGRMGAFYLGRATSFDSLTPLLGKLGLSS